MKKTWIIISVVVAIAAAIGAYVLSSKLSDMVHAAVVDYVNERVSKLAHEATNQKAKITIGDVSYSILTGAVFVDDIDVTFNDATPHDTTHAHIAVAGIKVSGMLPWDVLDGEGLSVGEIIIDKPSFQIRYKSIKASFEKAEELKDVNDTTTLKIPRTPNVDSIAHALIMGLLPQNIAPLRIGKIAFVDATGDFESIGSASHMSGSYSDLDVTFNEINIGEQRATGLHVLKSVEIHIGQLRRKTVNESLIKSSGVDIAINHADTLLTIDTLLIKAEKGYTFLTMGIEFSRFKHRICIDSFALGPTQTDDEFYADPTNIPDRFRVSGSSLVLQNIDMHAFQRRDGLIVDSITLKQCDLNILSSRRNLSAIPTRPPMIYQIVRRLPFYVSIGSVLFTNTSIHYGELHPHTTKHAVLKWSGVTCSVKGLTTDTALQSKQPLVFDAHGTFMSSTPMKAVIAMPLNVKQYALSAQGSLGAIDATELNSFLPTAEKIRVSSGRVQKATFDIKVQNGKATGVVDPYYTNLNIEVLDQKTRKSTFILGIASWLANWVGVRNDNNGDDHKKGAVTYKSNPNDAIMQTIWYPIKDGLGDVIGF